MSDVQRYLVYDGTVAAEGVFEPAAADQTRYVMASDYDALAAELDENEQTRAAMRAILDRAVDALHDTRAAGTMRSWHNIPDLLHSLSAENDALRAAVDDLHDIYEDFDGRVPDDHMQRWIEKHPRGTERTADQPAESLEEIAATQKWPHDPRCRCETCDPPSRER